MNQTTPLSPAALREQLARQVAARFEQLACYITAHALPPAAAADLLRDEAERLSQQQWEHH
ncbi:hypothetical protein CYR55_03040 [Chimaeribacter californicus]|uniref:DUF2732 domain-containing protein n=1 Tax=Chimaeribacter californicus TaxID=2060067 RepID=A0A2N5EEF7_9GAMM|nr:hypothetical protein [Chimaeribacter californicus]PLR40914.1 hypothetical protein CYR55_03040 [Chimaeribacter californicus]